MTGERRIGHELRIMTNLIKRQMTPDKDNLTGAQSFLLGYIANSKSEVYQRDIEKEFNIRRSTATQLLKKLESGGYIVKETSNSDSRLKKLILTDKAIKRHKFIISDIEKIEKIISMGLTKSEIEEFFRIADKIKSNLNK